MTIDIIDLDDPAYADLSDVQMAMVEAAQKKKDKIVADMAEEQGRIFRLLLSNNIARSSAYQYEYDAIAVRAQNEVDVLLADLMRQIEYSAVLEEGNSEGVYRYPENPNYNLNYSQRFLVVREYYMTVTEDAEARLQAFAMDSLARTYLGEYYQTLYSLLASYV